ncbi:class I SAM-dependent methyltransferase [Paractinoplanes hotanensis]|uniref:Class I SAM-dependent methyltransferase n=1 Tax=Paractinoplanes hotanensis TaxID=2906497 RepID=A0ABT0Y4L0_9ACTN|nr:class I SAM-dependent methyltransferase [Actinoplanes hotanensis]MCM4080937.1 class I SAM-dependent methyltransferase [Actinoplanes hotanensis]
MSSTTGYGGATRWNGPSGQAWVQLQSLMDGMYRPLEDLLVGTVDPGRRGVLDVGCGTGVTTVAVAERLAPGGRCVGVDISASMIAAAEARGAGAEFLCADVQEHQWAADSFDTVISRFGVMFFDDPVRAFSNLRRAATPEADLTFVAWRAIEENPFMTAAERAAAPLLPNLPPRRVEGPGQFAFADAAKVRTILDAAGWAGITIDPVDVECAFPESDLVGYFTRLGPVGLALPDADDPIRTKVIDAVRPAFAPYVKGSDVRFTAACWLVRAQASAPSATYA